MKEVILSHPLDSDEELDKIDKTKIDKNDSIAYTNHLNKQINSLTGDNSLYQNLFYTERYCRQAIIV